ncbi:YdcF family protein [Aldersonia sp. NBC_00410]|uniref:YdcF family protein n=1 Tax=Aldersonia sp. NBC_00410 TaxID=2975954 RepID=UPI0022532D23|nr:YdcF family protein [Aldersonia sp. NBC_00410]MCX5044411.1 YdcF family protein [Aldersonia sp. NBC_00410]
MQHESDRYKSADPGVRGRSVRFVTLAVNLLLAAVLALGLGLAGPTTAAAAPPNQLYNEAQGAFSRGDPGLALGRINELLAANPGDTDAQALRAMYADYTGDLISRFDALNRSGPRRGQVDYALGAIAASSFTPPNPFPAILGPQTAIVVLGYGLLPDGTMRPELVNRLRSAAVQALIAPGSPVIVTGGNPQNGITEAAAMQGWLIANGVPANRVHAEHRAGSTVGNALNSVPLARSLGANSVALVTSANHIRRATVDFNVAGLGVVGAMSTTDELLGQLPPVGKRDQLGMYVDASRVMGLPGVR